MMVVTSAKTLFSSTVASSSSLKSKSLKAADSFLSAIKTSIFHINYSRSVSNRLLPYYRFLVAKKPILGFYQLLVTKRPVRHWKPTPSILTICSRQEINFSLINDLLSSRKQLLPL
jgi:hypothetical protein